jgi:hypothetical protein
VSLIYTTACARSNDCRNLFTCPLGIGYSILRRFLRAIDHTLVIVLDNTLTHTSGAFEAKIKSWEEAGRYLLLPEYFNDESTHQLGRPGCFVIHLP